jgi:hypothetical protein
MTDNKLFPSLVVQNTEDTYHRDGNEYPLEEDAVIVAVEIFIPRVDLTNVNSSGPIGLNEDEFDIFDVDFEERSEEYGISPLAVLGDELFSLALGESVFDPSEIDGVVLPGVNLAAEVAMEKAAAEIDYPFLTETLPCEPGVFEDNDDVADDPTDEDEDDWKFATGRDKALWLRGRSLGTGMYDYTSVEVDEIIGLSPNHSGPLSMYRSVTEEHTTRHWEDNPPAMSFNPRVLLDELINAEVAFGDSDDEQETEQEEEQEATDASDSGSDASEDGASVPDWLDEEAEERPADEAAAVANDD